MFLECASVELKLYLFQKVNVPNMKQVEGTANVDDFIFVFWFLAR